MIIKTQPTRHVFLTFALGCLAAIVATSTTAAQSSSIEFPYQALVSKDNALVRSGPGKVHYGTQKLSAGQVVQVYRHDPDGWCAIRPIEGSFCIIPESTVEVIGEGVGEIKLAGTTPFVGTKLGSVDKPLWQVKLREKEKVSLIGQLSWPNPEGHSTIWYQIKPPAGEFRWINVSNLESLSGATMASVIAPQPIVNSAAKPVPQSIAVTPRPPAALRSTPSRPTVAPEPPAVANQSAAVNQSTFIPTKPNVDLATAGQSAFERPAANTIQSNIPTRPPVQPRPSARNDFAADQSSVQLASFTPVPAPATLPSNLPEPAAPAVATLPPLQDSGSGWRRATRSIPSDSSAKSAGADFDSRSATRDDRQPYDPTPNYSNARFANQQFNTNTASPNPNRNYQPDGLNSARQSQQSYSGQIRVADANPSGNRFAQQLNRSGGMASTYTSQTSGGSTLQTLNNRLTVEMLKAPSQWQLAPLEVAARQNLSTATSYTQQQAAQQFLDKLTNCRQVAAGYGGSGFPNGQLNTNANFGAGSGSGFTGSRVNGNNFGSNAQFDATGWLNELKQARGTDPSTYVLQDENGKIIYHVTPMPGINLNRYLKKRVGVNGQLGFNQRLNLNHVTIERVFPL